ncbi:hypothetical protein LRS10_09910 [Phenylobacterium sp. J426]|uniref:hypothetical protein n=1 Tax=Phenylobacterium sp. J426 TaxID=2898439 RepID=UPI00215121C5|nr:hypothetical protein [Phenylobacterium sp. J426]MCR5874456.1 hypothetical protein [Phenylobacterium sp. J426]
MSLRLLIAAGLVLGAPLAVGACAGSRAAAPEEVKAVVLDEGSRQAAQAVAAREADSKEALDAAPAAATTESPRF